MSVNINNKDTSFFTIASPDIVETEKDLTSKIISLTINEEMGRLPYGTLTLYDPTLIYARILRNGLKLDITWGYKVFDVSERSLVLVSLNSDEMSGRRERRGFNAIISGPSGAGTQGGQLIYNCNFSSLGFRGDEFARVHKSGYKKDIISRVFDELGISTVFRDIRFTRGDEKLSEHTNVRQNETNFQFLVRISYEWRALFRLGHTPKGDIAGIFIDPDAEQVKEAVRIGAQYIEINTTKYSELKQSKQRNLKDEIIQIARVAKAARREGLKVHAGHGLDYRNIQALLSVTEISTFSIGFAIVGRAVFVGFRQATNEMVSIIKGVK